MASVKSLVGEKILIQIGDGGSPTETFAHDCLINAERSFSISAEVIDTTVPDCDNPSAPAWKSALTDGISVSVSGAGVLHTASVEAFFNWITSGANKNVRIKLDATGANGGGYIAGAFKLTQFNVNGTRKNTSTAEITLQSDGACTWTDNA